MSAIDQLLGLVQLVQTKGVETVLKEMQAAATAQQEAYVANQKLEASLNEKQKVLADHEAGLAKRETAVHQMEEQAKVTRTAAENIMKEAETAKRASQDFIKKEEQQVKEDRKKLQIEQGAHATQVREYEARMKEIDEAKNELDKKIAAVAALTQTQPAKQ